MSTSTDPTVRFWVPGRAAPQGSKRHVGNGVMVESSKAVKPWRATVAGFAVDAMAGRPPMRGPVRATLVFGFRRPKKHYGTGKNAGRLKPDAPAMPCDRGTPDLDKLVRAVKDAMKNVCWLDDCQVVSLGDTCKVYADREGLTVELLELVQ